MVPNCKKNITEQQIIISNEEPIGENRKKIWLFTKRNYINEGHFIRTVVNGVTVARDSSTGKITFDGTPTANGCFYIPIYLTKGNYVFSYTGNHIAPHFTFRSGNTSYISTFAGSDSASKYLTVTENGQYIIGLNFTTGNTYTPTNTSFNVQLERGTEENSYKPFEIDTVYIKNENNEYEQYLKEDIIYNNLTTSSKNTYSCDYINNNFNIVQANELMTLKTGYTAYDTNIFRQGNHYFGNITIQKNEGYFTNSQVVVATLTKSCKGVFNTFCGLSNSQWESVAAGYCYFGGTVCYVADKLNRQYNVAKIHIDVEVN